MSVPVLFQQAVSSHKVSLALSKYFSGATKWFNDMGPRKTVTELQQFIGAYVSDEIKSNKKKTKMLA